MNYMEDILDEASLKEQKVFSLKKIKYLRGENTYSNSCYLKEGLVSIMPKYYHQNSQGGYYELMWAQCRRNNMTLRQCPYV